MKLHTKKMLAPIVITGIVLLYYLGFFFACFSLELPFLVKLLGGILPLLLAGTCIYVLVERIKEIRSGVEDDLSQY